jgi:DNA replication protein DnaC
LLPCDETSISQIKEHDKVVRTSLNDEQQRAYDIINCHLQQTLHGQNPPQLRMIIPGEGGTGKSHTIQAITNSFIQRNVKSWLVKGAYTGIAASIINGSTLQ